LNEIFYVQKKKKNLFFPWHMFRATPKFLDQEKEKAWVGADVPAAGAGSCPMFTSAGNEQRR
jgi:hypothetical protein